ncbi:alpha/beta hydrolase [Oerskovia turbata]|uniref:Alpha/beta hydrolase n=1 Tax=Oerskovia turbata TaxID=1713 RepID=A0A4Q1L2T3_9CELL|nr:alpha/beta hydrolase [Oerskovia turbata]RXR26881.1 alpha/beta hydrolase [Oerskovia turbata]RXR36277.1 alpha/beta hydrolase [Oerskovia turbata]
MPIGYLVPVLLVACCTSASLSPARRSPRLGRLAFRMSVLVNEQPFILLLVLGAVTALALADGDVETTGGRVALALAALTALGLVLVARRGLRAAPALDHALVDGLRAGPGTVTNRGLPWARILLAPFAVRRRDVERLADLAYGDSDDGRAGGAGRGRRGSRGREHRLDVYRPRSRPADGPTLVYFHGGGYVSGRKELEARAMLSRLASRGWVCVSANYGLRPTTNFPGHLVDAKRVLAWVRAHGATYGADTRRVLVAGSSAEAHLASLVALTPRDPRFQPGFEDADTTVVGAVCPYGYFGEYYGSGRAPGIETAPGAYLHPAAPPFLVVHGDQDTLVPVEGARRFVADLRGVSTSPVVYAELPGAQHGFDLFHSVRFDAVVTAVEEFADRVVAARDRASEARVERHEER